ncbi:hypothetical protein AALP_AA5G126600 [Arabis alpina]|uniref:Uncharacterized protein n=1 Tax=Arabis alpina TaxID=50452 RepID=A0A087GWP3_ARAAL|nr:hypothetical protein AALP_AA5G126600 [Arabis alpina]
MDPYPVLPEFDEIPFVIKSEGYEWPAEAILTQEQEEEFIHILAVEKKAHQKRQGMKYKKRENPDAPGSTLSSVESLDKLRSEFEIPNEVEFGLPRSFDRADDPPPGYFTMYENSIEECFLTFPIPSVILEYFWRHKIALAQATPRGIRHLVGLLVRGRECCQEVTVYHYMNLLKIGSRGRVGNDLIVAIGAQTGCLVIDDHPTKDRHWINYFFYVKISEASVGDQWLEKVVTRWRYRGLSGFPSCPDGLFTDFFSAEMAAQERAQAENLADDAEMNPPGGQGGVVQDQPIISDVISEVPQEKLKKSRRSKKPPRIPVSDEVIPSSSAGASAACTAIEPGEESLSKKRKKKRSSRSSSVGRVQSPVRAVLTDGLSESVIDDSKTAAWFANIQYHGHEGPLPAALVSDPNFGLMSRHGSRSELHAYQRKCVEAKDRAIEESAKASTLQRQLADEKTDITSRIRRATKAAMLTFATKFQGKIDCAKEKIKALGGNPKKKLVQLAQVEANIEFARIIREAPDSLDAEAAKAKAWLPNVAGGDAEFDSLFAGLDSDLVILPISSDSSGTARDNVSLETLAADVGIRAFDGSMMGELGVNHDDDEYVNIDD